MDYISIKNNGCIPLTSIPELEYEKFLASNVFDLMSETPNHCVNYYGFPDNGKIRLICCIANDDTHMINISSTVVVPGKQYSSFSAHNLAFEKFEREIHENFNIAYHDHPWLKPVRYSSNRVDKNKTIANYPFYSIASEELHEVGVGPIHAGIIEPGHFRFICNGEQILHLEIQLGYQHRGIEQLFLEKKNLLQRTTLAESITGDTVVGHTTAFVNLWESLCEFKPECDLQFARTLALELERIARHTGDLSGMCTDIAYQLGSSVLGRLRTPIVNYFQQWCGNRVSKSLIRAGKSNFPFTQKLASTLTEVFNNYEPDFNEMCAELFRMPSALSRFEKTGVVSEADVRKIGAVGLSARMNGVNRDIRLSHPHDFYPEIQHQPIIKHHGDVYSRAQMRRKEIGQSMGYIRNLMKDLPDINTNRPDLESPQANVFALSLVEGWRGEICHCAITDEKGELRHYKIKDPSFHNWLVLALAVRNNEISDFPISNKSFDFSYSGHDL